MSEFLRSKLKLEVVNELNRVRQKHSMKKRILNAIDREIDVIKGRVDLKLKQKLKTIDGKTYTVNENRFWKPSTQYKDKVLVTVKLKGKTFGFGEEVDSKNIPYLLCDNKKESLIEFLTMIKTELESVDESDSDFWFVGKKSENNEEVEETEEETEEVLS